MTDEVLFTQKGSIGFITLNRPAALHALTLTMIIQLQKQLELWKVDKTIHAVVLRATEGNAFCAGGDIRWLYQAKDTAEQMQFFAHEYRLNNFIQQLGKPYIALMDGVTMGGGVGVAMHGSHPVASERFVFAMPETSIGFFPDIGASYLLNRCPGFSGFYLGLTGARIGPQEAMQLGLVKHHVVSAKIPSLVQDLIKKDLSMDAHNRVSQCLEAYAEPFPAQTSMLMNPLIEVCFAQPTMDAINESLQGCKEAWAENTYRILGQKSPLSLKVTLLQLQKTKNLPLAECLKIDFVLAGHFMQDSDFYEGVRALIIEKDKNPQWRPQRLDLVSEKKVASYFEYCEEGE